MRSQGVATDAETPLLMLYVIKLLGSKRFNEPCSSLVESDLSLDYTTILYSFQRILVLDKGPIEDSSANAHITLKR